MEVQTRVCVDPHSGQQISYINPMEKSRRLTDKLFIFVLLLIVIAWFEACISGQDVYRSPNILNDEVPKILKAINDTIDTYLSRFSSQILIPLFISTIGTLFCIFLNSKFTKFFMYLGLGLYILGTGFILYFSFSIKLFCFLNPLILIVYIGSFLKVDENELFEVFKDSCRTIVYNPSIVLFTFLISILEFSVFLFTLKALVHYLLYTPRGEYYMSYDYVAMMLGGIYLQQFIFNFAVMVISDYTVNYYWENASIKHSLAQIFRNHIGTLMFSSLLVIPFLCTLVQALKHKRSRKNDKNVIFYYASKLLLILSMRWDALIFSSIYGTGFVKSAQKTFDTVLRHCVLYLATNGAVTALLVIDAIVILLYMYSFVVTVTFISIIQAEDTQESDDKAKYMIPMVLYVMMYPVIIIIRALHYSAKALLANKIIVLNKEDQCSEGQNTDEVRVNCVNLR